MQILSLVYTICFCFFHSTQWVEGKETDSSGRNRCTNNTTAPLPELAERADLEPELVFQHERLTEASQTGCHIHGQNEPADVA